MSKAIYWFRNNLRIHDNPSLFHAVKDCEALIFIYIVEPRLLDEHPLGFPAMGPWREQFWLESVNDLKQSLNNLGATLHVLHGKPNDILKNLSETTGINTIITSREVAYYERKEEAAIQAWAELKKYDDGFLYAPEQLPLTAATLPRSFTGYRKKVEKKVKLRDLYPAPDQLHEVEFQPANRYHFNVTRRDHDVRSAHPFAGGERSGRERLKDYVWNTRALGHYKKTRNKLIGTEYSSKFSSFLALGCLSPVEIARQVKAYEKEYGSNVSTYWLVFEMLWRDFFRLVSLKHGKKLFWSGGIQDKNLVFDNDLEVFRRWCQGETGQPFVDANMKELVATGFMSNRGRQNAASYLWHDLKQDWRWGAAFFESHLIDYDCASNWGNWMYVSGVGNSSKPGGFDVEWQQKKYDRNQEYVNMWLTT